LVLILLLIGKHVWLKALTWSMKQN